MSDNDKHLSGQSRPTVEQAAWVISHLDDAMRETGTFRYLIYQRMKYGPEAYSPLLSAGGMNLTNAFIDLEEYRKLEMRDEWKASVEQSPGGE